MATLSFRNINKIYDNNVQAVFDFNLEVADKEFIVFVGPSGCGKSTTLRMVAGLEQITSGELYIDGVLMNNIEPKKRDIAMVFQSYALYPHMNVYKNMAFSLKLKHTPKEEIDARVQEAAKILGLEHYLNRKPLALSGGQRQRVALGRAIVRKAKIFLMDEPLSNLDAKLRVQMRSEIAKIHRRVGATTIYVTHDQTEAMTMATRIVVMKDGYIQQIGTPKEVYNYPENLFVASFIGSPSMNFLQGMFDGESFHIEKDDGEVILTLSEKVKARLSKHAESRIPELEEKLSASEKEVAELEEKLGAIKAIRKNKNAIDDGQKRLEEAKKRLALRQTTLEGYKKHRCPFTLGIRPEDIYLEEDEQKIGKSELVPVLADSAELLGHELIIYGFIGKQPVLVKTSAKFDAQPQEKKQCYFDMDKVHFFDSESTLRIKD